MARKTIILNEEQTKLIIERITDRLWHFTQPSTIIAILKTDKIGLTFQQNRSDAYSNKHFYYLSASRTKTAFDNSWGFSKIARIELDGHELSKKYSGRPVNYYGQSKGGPTERGLFEYEDRIIADQPFIPEATKYIRRIDLLAETGNKETTERVMKQCQEILQLAKDKGTPVYIYDNKKDYSRQSDNTINQQVENYTAENNTDNENPYTRPVDFETAIAELFSAYYLMTNDDVRNFNSEDTKTKLRQLLEKFNLEKYTDKAFEQIRFSSPAYKLEYGVVRTMSNWTDFRQAHLTSQNNEDGLNLQRLATYLMRMGNAKSMDILISNILNGKYDKENKTQETVTIVLYGNKYSSRESLADGDKPMKEFVNAESALESIRIALEDDDMYLRPDEDEYDGHKRKIHHKSKNMYSLLKFLERKFNNGNCTLKEYADMLNKIFNNEEDMEEYMGYHYRTETLDKKRMLDRFDELSTLGGYDLYEMIDKLFGTFENFLNARNMPKA